MFFFNSYVSLPEGNLRVCYRQSPFSIGKNHRTSFSNGLFSMANCDLFSEGNDNDLSGWGTKKNWQNELRIGNIIPNEKAHQKKLRNHQGLCNGCNGDGEYISPAVCWNRRPPEHGSSIVFGLESWDQPKQKRPQEIQPRTCDKGCGKVLGIQNNKAALISRCFLVYTLYTPYLHLLGMTHMDKVPPNLWPG